MPDYQYSPAGACPCCHRVRHNGQVFRLTQTDKETFTLRFQQPGSQKHVASSPHPQPVTRVPNELLLFLFFSAYVFLGFFKLRALCISCSCYCNAAQSPYCCGKREMQQVFKNIGALLFSLCRCLESSPLKHLAFW